MTSYSFSACKIAERSVQVEEKGFEFYKAVAELAVDKKVKKVFRFLAAAEAEHKKIFKAIAEAQKKSDTREEFSFDIAREIQNLIEKVENAVFDLKSVKGILDIQKCLDIGIQVETELIKAYSELYETFIGQYHAVLTKVVAEEKKHLKMLQGVKKSLAKIELNQTCSCGSGKKYKQCCLKLDKNRLTSSVFFSRLYHFMMKRITVGGKETDEKTEGGKTSPNPSFYKTIILTFLIFGVTLAGLVVVTKMLFTTLPKKMDPVGKAVASQEQKMVPVVLEEESLTPDEEGQS